MLQIQLPLKPLPVSQAYFGKWKKTEKYRQFETDALWLLPRNKKVSGEVEVFFRFYLKYYKSTDCDNLIKTVQDCLVKGGLIDDDKYIIALHAQKFPSVADYMEIDIVPFSPVK